MLEYQCTIYQIKRWTQEFLDYDFIVLNCATKMMKDVDALFSFSVL